VVFARLDGPLKWFLGGTAVGSYEDTIKHQKQFTPGRQPDGQPEQTFDELTKEAERPTPNEDARKGGDAFEVKNVGEPRKREEEIDRTGVALRPMKDPGSKDQDPEKLQNSRSSLRRE